jgi:hypothetical protein
MAVNALPESELVVAPPRVIDPLFLALLEPVIVGWALIRNVSGR